MTDSAKIIAEYCDAFEAANGRPVEWIAYTKGWVRMRTSAGVIRKCRLRDLIEWTQRLRTRVIQQPLTPEA